MTFKYEGAGWYETRGGDKAYVVGEVPEGVDVVEKYTGFVQDCSHPVAWGCEGEYYTCVQDRWDLIRKAPEKKTLWINIYADGTSRTRTLKGEADLCARAGRIARIKVEYEEGQFDE